MKKNLILIVSLLAVSTATSILAKPLKVYILVGQSNMEGHAQVTTFDHIGMDPKTAPMLKEMRHKDGSPRVCKDVHISYLTGIGGWGKPMVPKEKQGKLTVGFGAQGREPKIGPEFTFGIYMHKQLNEPILLIKTAWGGKSLHTDFRSPSADPKKTGAEVSEQEKTKEGDPGHYYHQMIDYVKKVLADPGKVSPSYDKKEGYEIAGFVWFQGFNDLVASRTYPNRTKPGGYDLYSELLCHFIRDVRKDLNAPKMPFVIGVLGVNGEPTKEQEAAKPARYRGMGPGFRKAMAAPASMPEFKGNVSAVFTDKYWDYQLEELAKRMSQKVNTKVKEAEKGGAFKGLKKNELRAAKSQLTEKLEKENFTAEELKILSAGKSNKGFHYLGSSKIIGQIGKSFAEALIKLEKGE